jgi:hypothetical protein
MEVVECVGASFADASTSASVVVQHGDKHDPRFSNHQIAVESKLFEQAGKKIHSPWKEDGTLSVEYLVDASILHDKGDAAGPSDARLLRIISADEDVARLHQARVQRDCQPFDFQAMLNSSHLGSPKEKIICVLTCKAILNAVSLGNKRDLFGDCYAILTESEDPNEKFRKVYFVQVAVIQYNFCLKILNLKKKALRFFDWRIRNVVGGRSEWIMISSTLTNTSERSSRQRGVLQL